MDLVVLLGTVANEPLVVGADGVVVDELSATCCFRLEPIRLATVVTAVLSFFVLPPVLAGEDGAGGGMLPLLLLLLRDGPSWCSSAIDLAEVLSKSLLLRSSRFFVGLCDPAGSSKEVRCFSELEIGCSGESPSSEVAAVESNNGTGVVVVLSDLTSSKVGVCDFGAPEVDSIT